MPTEHFDSSANGSQRPTPASGISRTARLLGEARAGSDSALGRLLDDCRDYLLLVANEEVPSDIRQKVAASDLVQETLAEACQAFGRFDGRDNAALLAWLRRILLNNVVDATRGFRDTAKRDVSREVPLAADESNEGLLEQLIDGESSPTNHAIVAEQQQYLLGALDRLPEHYAQVIRLRNLEYRSFAEIGGRLELSANSARKLWERAVSCLAIELRPSNGGA